ncbi:MAG: hypothetical protein SFU98_06795 [Leptospiraceae bacterium]|nr:hypothetical protein [Leptospiraceae bacterium]
MLIALFIFFPTTFLSAQSKLKWNNFLVQKYKKEHDTVSILNAKSKKLIYKEDFHLINKMGFYRAGKNNLLAIEYYSGGESGCCMDLDIYFFKNKIQKLSFENLGYADFPPMIVDLDADGYEEIRTTSEKFYGYSFNQKEFQCPLTPGSYEGFSKFQFPVYHIITKNSKSVYSSKEITFEPKYRKFLKPYLVSFQKFISKQKQFISHDTNLAATLQYYHYQLKLQGKEKTLKEFKSYPIKLEVNCFDEKMEPNNKTLSLDLHKFLEDHSNDFE